MAPYINRVREASGCSAQTPHSCIPGFVLEPDSIWLLTGLLQKVLTILWSGVMRQHPLQRRMDIYLPLLHLLPVCL